MISPVIEQSAVQMGPELGATVIIKATVVLTAAAFGTLILRRASASVRYAVWSVAITMLILLPLLSLVVPTSWPGEVVPSLEPRPPSLHSLIFQQSGSPLAAGSVPASTYEPTKWPSGTEPSIPLSRIAPILEVLLIAWLAGSAVMLVRLGIHLLRVNAITRHGWPAEDAEIRRIAERTSLAAGAKRAVRIIMSDRSSLPFSWGILHPTVVLPAAADRWPTEQKESVLLHEIAHIARRDYPIHIAVEIARALYWPNPLIWLASRRCAMERERACDDCALRGGAASDRYATHLIEIARAQVEGAPLSATTMAGEPGIIERIRYVMNETLDRSPIDVGKFALVLSLAFALTLPLASMKVLSAEDWYIPSTKELVAGLLNDEDPIVRRRAAWWLGEHEDTTAVPAVIKGLRDEDASVRLAAGWALGEIKDKDAIRPLIRTLENDEDYYVREMAALALGEIEDPAAVVPLMEAFKREKDMQRAIVWALGEIKGDEADVAQAIAFGRMGEEPRRNEEVWATAENVKFEDVNFEVGTLLGQIKSEDADERYRAAILLGVLGAVDGIDEVEMVADALLDAMRDPVPEVRAAAVWSLDETNPSRSIRAGKHHSETSITEHRMNALGYVFLQAYRLDEAIEIFKANVQLHPDSYNVYDSLGEAYMRSGQVDLAIENYEKSLEINPDNEHGSEILEILYKLR